MIEYNAVVSKNKNTDWVRLLGKFDMSILAKSDSIDAVSAALNFPSFGEFLVALTKLGVEAGQYLQGHTPSVVIYDPEMKAHFIKELNKRRAASKHKEGPSVTLNTKGTYNA